MIENERQLQAARDGLAYWKEQIAKGGQSWLALERARLEVMKLRREIAEYEKRTRASQAEQAPSSSTGTSLPS